jgi:hypothetical protein
LARRWLSDRNGIEQLFRVAWGSRSHLGEFALRDNAKQGAEDNRYQMLIEEDGVEFSVLSFAKRRGRLQIERWTTSPSFYLSLTHFIYLPLLRRCSKVRNVRVYPSTYRRKRAPE